MTKSLPRALANIGKRDLSMFGHFEHGQAFREKERTPEHELWAAVLWAAVVDCCYGSKEALIWFATVNRQVSGFDWICETLDLDNVEQIRKLMIDFEKRVRLTQKISWNKLSSTRSYKSTALKRKDRDLCCH